MSSDVARGIKETLCYTASDVVKVPVLCMPVHRPDLHFQFESLKMTVWRMPA